VVAQNPVQAVERPAINRWEGMTSAFTPPQARALLDALDSTTMQGLRDRAMLSVGLRVGLRRSEIIRLNGEWGEAGRCPTDGRACRSLDDAALRSS
jgi:site-specific recombinase XerD